LDATTTTAAAASRVEAAGAFSTATLVVGHLHLELLPLALLGLRSGRGPPS
jgi:hypothetical protein